MDDLISRHAAIDALGDAHFKNYGNAIMVIQALPSAEPVRHGRWIDGHCSICGCDVPAYINDWKWQKDMNARFCPMCGARMNAE